MQIDWIGNPLFITDSVTGERLPACIFVAVLLCSWYTYVGVCDDIRIDSIRLFKHSIA